MAVLPEIPPMLATPGSLPAPAVEDRWAVETKHDGQRATVYLPGDGSVLLRSRAGLDITPAYPELRGLGEALGGVPAVLDGEIVAYDGNGRPDFERLQSRMGLAGSPARAAQVATAVPAHLVLFDATFLATENLTGRPWTERREALVSLGLDGPSWSVPGALVGHGAQALEHTRAAGLEGIVCKATGSPYEPGVRSRSWIKIRNVRTVDAIVGGWIPGQGRLAGLPGALLLGQYRDGELRYIGNVGTGWSDRQRSDLAALLTVAEVSRSPFSPAPRVARARWALPRLVGEVGYTTWTRAGLLRHPSWHRLRPDLAPDDIG
ncbi:ATP-dependent DNA ligase [Actinacidiphila paucisporea]|nr:RNA ligase family protein [Actinacidiphila paucisporea]